tara:strand:- start:19 stop:1074 length:1056 start_codon:yes stop_codon:yes gene_type:complete
MGVGLDVGTRFGSDTFGIPMDTFFNCPITFHWSFHHPFQNNLPHKNHYITYITIKNSNNNELISHQFLIWDKLGKLIIKIEKSKVQESISGVLIDDDNDLWNYFDVIIFNYKDNKLLNSQRRRMDIPQKILFDSNQNILDYIKNDKNYSVDDLNFSYNYNKLGDLVGVIENQITNKNNKYDQPEVGSMEFMEDRVMEIENFIFGKEYKINYDQNNETLIIKKQIIPEVPLQYKKIINPLIYEKNYTTYRLKKVKKIDCFNMMFDELTISNSHDSEQFIKVNFQFINSKDNKSILEKCKVNDLGYEILMNYKYDHYNRLSEFKVFNNQESINESFIVSYKNYDKIKFWDGWF